MAKGGNVQKLASLVENFARFHSSFLIPGNKRGRSGCPNALVR